jgi:hypothetical protein
LAVALAVAGTGGLAGCTQAEDEVATLATGSPTNGAESSLTRAEEIAAQARAAEDFVACLAEVDISAFTEPDVDPDAPGQLWVQFDIAGDYIASLSGGLGVGEQPDWMLEMAAEYDPRIAVIMDERAGGPSPAPGWEDQEGQPFLIIGATDRTEDFVQCLDSSGYTEPFNYPPEPADEIAVKQANLAATLPWIECARANGYPDMKDPLPVQADEWQTDQVAVLPADISEAALRALLEACPSFDEAAWLAHDQAMADLGPNPTSDQVAEVDAKYPQTGAMIGFDVPGADGDSRPGRPTDAPYPDSVIRGYEIIREEKDRYLAEHADLIRGS